MSRDIDLYSQDYQRLPFERTQLEFRRKFVLEQIAHHQPTCLLEVGCGLHPLFPDLSSDMEIMIVEPSAEFAYNAKKIAAEKNNVIVVNEYLERISNRLHPEGFDFVVISSLLHEVEHPEDLLQSLRQHCRKDCVLHINVPNAHSFHRLLATEMGLISDPFELSSMQKHMQQTTTFDLKSLVALVEGVGYEIISAGSYFVKPFTHEQMQYLRDIGFLTDAHLQGLYGLSRHLPGVGSEIYINVSMLHA